MTYNDWWCRLWSVLREKKSWTLNVTKAQEGGLHIHCFHTKDFNTSTSWYKHRVYIKVTGITVPCISVSTDIYWHCTFLKMEKKGVKVSRLINQTYMHIKGINCNYTLFASLSPIGMSFFFSIPLCGTRCWPPENKHKVKELAKKVTGQQWTVKNLWW